MKPKLSVGLPVYNGLPFLEETLDSLLCQTFNDFELIISDNSSQDGSADLCRRLAAGNPRIRFLQQPRNVGAAENFNRVFREANGEFFKWAATDDCCLPDHLEKCVAVLEDHPDVVLCYPKTTLVDMSQGERREYEDGLDLDRPCPRHRFDRLLRGIDMANAIFGVFRRATLADTRLLGSYPSSDLVLLGEAALRGCFHEIPDRLFERRIHPAQSMQAYVHRQDRATWFRPDRPLGRYFPCWRTLLEFGKAVHRAPLPRSTKAACWLSLRHWPIRYRRDHWRDLRSGIFRLLAAKHNNTSCTETDAVATPAVKGLKQRAA